MNLKQGQFHRRTGLDYAILLVQVAICAVVIGTVAYYFADAWVREDTARVSKLQKHLYEVAYSRATVAPAAPTGVRPNYGDMSTPKTQVFADTSVKLKDKIK